MVSLWNFFCKRFFDAKKRILLKNKPENLQIPKKVVPLHPDTNTVAGVVKLVDTLDLGSSASRRGGSSPFTRTRDTRHSN